VEAVVVAVVVVVVVVVVVDGVREMLVLQPFVPLEERPWPWSINIYGTYVYTSIHT
jgi:hypothetical protein